MVRLTLQGKNTTGVTAPLDFASTGTLTIPIRDKKTVSVLRFNIPNAGMPLMIWPGDNIYAFTMSYGGFSFTSYVTYINIGGQEPFFTANDQLIWDINNLILMFNQALRNAIVGLDALISLPSPGVLVPPVIKYDEVNNFFTLTVTTQGGIYDYTNPNRIKIYMNEPLFYFFQSIPSGYDTLVQLYYFICDSRYAVVDATISRMTINQTAISLQYWASFVSIVITTSMPIESEILTSFNVNSNQTGLNILATYDIHYENGLKDILTNNQFNSVSEPFRRVGITGQNLYDIKCKVYMLTNNGDLVPFFIPPFGIASITLEFL